MFNELTEVDIRKMQEEIDSRMRVVRPKCIEDLKTARGFGDLSENYEYKAAKQELRRCDSRLRYLRRMIATAKVIEADAREGLRLAQHKLPLKTKIIAREKTNEGGEA